MQGSPLHDTFVMFVDALQQRIKLKLMGEQEALEALPRYTALVAEIATKLPPDDSV
jgi:hypothetical protein